MANEFWAMQSNQRYKSVILKSVLLNEGGHKLIIRRDIINRLYQECQLEAAVNGTPFAIAYFEVILKELFHLNEGNLTIIHKFVAPQSKHVL